jgi:hypothetical protein
MPAGGTAHLPTDAANGSIRYKIARIASRTGKDHGRSSKHGTSREGKSGTQFWPDFTDKTCFTCALPQCIGDFGKGEPVGISVTGV